MRYTLVLLALGCQGTLGSEEIIRIDLEEAGMAPPPRMADASVSDGAAMDARMIAVGDAARRRDAAIALPLDASPAPPDAAPLPPDANLPSDRADPDSVCARWRMERRTVANEWRPTPGSDDACDPGTLSDEAQANAIRRTNLYRWLAGLEPVELDPDLRGQQQACAAIMNALGGLNHHPPRTAPCYTAEGAAGAGSSNLVGGTNAADSVDLYVSDRGVPSLGHRRWVLNPSAATTTFGHKGRFGCMYSFSQARRHQTEFVAWPPPGPLPAQAAQGEWHITLYGRRGTSIEISVGVDGAAPQPVEATPLPGGFGGQALALAFSPPAGTWAAGRAARVVVGGLQGADIDYTVRFVGCR